MKILSTFLPASEDNSLVPDGPAIVMAMDTLVDQKSLVVGVTIGAIEGQTLQDVRLSDIGRAIVARCGRHMQLNYPNGEVVIAGVASVSGAKERVRQVLTKAPPGSFVLLVATRDEVCAAVIRLMGLQHHAAHVNAQ